MFPVNDFYQTRLPTGDDETGNFSLLGDGTMDNVLAFTAALNTPFDVDIHAGTYYFASGNMDVNAGVAKRVAGRAGVVFSIHLVAGMDFIRSSRGLSFENIIFDFNGADLHSGFVFNPNCGLIQFKNCVFRNLKDTDSTYGTIVISINPQGNTFDLTDLSFSNLLKRGNGVIGEGAGNLDCIYVGGVGNYTVGSIRNITFNEIHNIDANNQIVYEDTAGIYIFTPLNDTQNDVSIDTIWGYNFGKRLIKIQASNVAVNNVTGYSIDGDSLGVIGFLGGDALGEKRGCSGSYIRAYGKMEYALSGSAVGVKWHDVVTVTTPGTKTGMSNAAFGLFINGNYTEVDGYKSASTYMIGIGSSSQIIIGTKLKNITLDFDSTIVYGLTDVNGNLGFDGLGVDGLICNVDASTTAIPFFFQYLTNVNKGKNLHVDNLTIVSNGPVNAYGISVQHVDNVSLSTYRYRNVSANKHFRLAIFDTCSNVSVYDVIIEGSAAIGVQLLNCTGRALVNNVKGDSCDYAVYNNNSGEVMVSNTDPAKVSGNVVTLLNQRYSAGATASRPASNLVAGQQHYDTTLDKPIWWSGAAWKDASGNVV